MKKKTVCDLYQVKQKDVKSYFHSDFNYPGGMCVCICVCAHMHVHVFAHIKKGGKQCTEILIIVLENKIMSLFSIFYILYKIFQLSNNFLKLFPGSPSNF